MDARRDPPAIRRFQADRPGDRLDPRIAHQHVALVDLVAGRQVVGADPERGAEGGQTPVDPLHEHRAGAERDAVHTVDHRRRARVAEGVPHADVALGQQHGQHGALGVRPLVPGDQRRLVRAWTGEDPATHALGHR